MKRKPIPETVKVPNVNIEIRLIPASTSSTACGVMEVVNLGSAVIPLDRLRKMSYIRAELVRHHNPNLHEYYFNIVLKMGHDEIILARTRDVADAEEIIARYTAAIKDALKTSTGNERSVVL